MFGPTLVAYGVCVTKPALSQWPDIKNEGRVEIRAYIFSLTITTNYHEIRPSGNWIKNRAVQKNVIFLLGIYDFIPSIKKFDKGFTICFAHLLL